MSKKKLSVIVLLMALHLTCYGNLVVNPGFETMEEIGIDIPTVYGDWDGDGALIVGSTAGITPFEGSQMLQFDRTFAWGWYPESNTSQVYQIIDISGYEAVVAAGNAYAIGSAYFNRVAGDSQTDTAFGMNIMAYDGSPSTFRDRWYAQGYDSALSWTGQGLYSDSDTSTWENISLSLQLPADTTFLVIQIKAHEDIYNDYEYPELDGHFADDVSIEIIPEPATVLLLGLGAIILRRKQG